MLSSGQEKWLILQIPASDCLRKRPYLFLSCFRTSVPVAVFGWRNSGYTSKWGDPAVIFNKRVTNVGGGCLHFLISQSVAVTKCVCERLWGVGESRVFVCVCVHMSVYEIIWVMCVGVVGGGRVCVCVLFSGSLDSVYTLKVHLCPQQLISHIMAMCVLNLQRQNQIPTIRFAPIIPYSQTYIHTFLDLFCFCFCFCWINTTCRKNVSPDWCFLLTSRVFMLWFGKQCQFPQQMFLKGLLCARKVERDP